MTHVECLPLRPGWLFHLIVLNVLQIYSLDMVTKIGLANFLISSQLKRQCWHSLVVFLLNQFHCELFVIHVFQAVDKISACCLYPQHHIIGFPQNLGTCCICFYCLLKTFIVSLRLQFQKAV